MKSKSDHEVETEAVSDDNRLLVGILCADGVEQVEVTVPREALSEAGLEVEVITPDGRPIRGYNYIEPGDVIESQLALEGAGPERYACLVLPGGLGGPDTLRKNPEAVNLVRGYCALGRPVATICHGPWLLIEAAALRHRQITCAEQITTDVVNAGGCFLDEEVWVDDSTEPVLVSGRNHQTVRQFADTLVETLRGR